MLSRTAFFLSALSVLEAAICPLRVPGKPPEDPAVRSGLDFFERKIRPVLVERCYPCHGSEVEKPKGGFRLDSREGLLRGGGRGPAIVPGDPGKSLLLRAIRRADPDLQMPPKDRLTVEQVSDFAAWISRGAPDPRSGKPSGEGTGAARAPAARKLWALEPLRDSPPPPVRDAGWPASPIDCYILAALEERGLRPARPADRRTLIRRASYDLHGLPPTAAEVEAFERDPSPRAFEDLVDRLLSSPRYGERWGRYWLDVARYADTKGYAYDREERRFVHSPSYRDWIIRALNEDLPYDRFLLLQIAADRLVEEGGDRRDLAAMGFLTVGRRFVNNIHDIIDDRIDVVMRGTQALTAGCARCHDHKFDPIPTRDYYSLYGIFNGSSENTLPLTATPERTPDYLAYEVELRAREEKLRSTFEAKREQLCERLRAKAAEYLLAVLEVEKLPSEEFYALLGPDDLNPVIVRQWQAYLFQTAKAFHPVFAAWNALASIPHAEFPARAQAVLSELSTGLPGVRLNRLVAEALLGKPPPASLRETAERYGRLFRDVHARWTEALKSAAVSGAPQPAALADPAEEELRSVLYGPDSPAAVPPGAISEIEWFFDEPTRVELARLQAEIDRWNISSPGAPGQAVILSDRAVQRNPRVFLRGNPARRGEEVPRQYLLALSGGKREPFRQGSGRLELAQAIARKDNPLTARVMVNRVWLHHFGAGLVSTPSDFGSRSDPPSHPELLDWLALRFMEDGWSLKRLHRRIMLSSVYRQDSRAEARSPAPSGAGRVDAENRLYSFMNRTRLDLEALRDSLLAASGELDLAMGGRPVDLTTRPAVPRRTVWGFVDRQFLPGFFRVFDFANPDQHSPERHATTVPQQALYFLNSPFVIERARALAARAEASGESHAAARIGFLYRATLQRRPDRRELEAGLAFLNAARPPVEAPPPPPAPAWRYGYGEYDELAARVKAFEALPHFTGEAWQGGPAWPDPKLGWVQLKAEGGHTGNDLQHAAIRRWIAPRSGRAAIGGKVVHSHPEGDGVRAKIVSSRAGLLWSAAVHKKSVEAKVDSAEIVEGDSIDFVVDLGGSLGFDDFSWAPTIRMLEGPAAGQAFEWDAKRDFGGPPEPIAPLTALEAYAQALLLSNEFSFID